MTETELAGGLGLLTVLVMILVFAGEMSNRADKFRLEMADKDYIQCVDGHLVLWKKACQ